MGILDNFRVDGKIALVTGAGRGIGKASALALAEAGADVVVAARTLEQVEQAHGLVAPPRREQQRLIHHVGELGAFGAAAVRGLRVQFGLRRMALCGVWVGVGVLLFGG